MVSLRLSRQVAAPNQCSSANSLFMSLTWHWHTCIALRVLRFATQFVTLLATPAACVRAATCVLHATSFFTSFVPLHFTTFVAGHLATSPGDPGANTRSIHPGRPAISLPSLPYSLGSISLHYVLHSYQSHSVHPLPIIWRALRPATATGLSWFLSCTHPSIKTKTHAKPLRLTVAAYRRCTAS